MDHSRIVQLAQFDINTDKLQDSVLESQKRLIELNKEIYKSVQAMAQLQKSIDAANKTSDALNNSNKKTGDAYVETNKNVIELMESEKKLMEENKKLRAERDKLQVSYNNEKALLEEVNKKNLEVSKSQQQVNKDTKEGASSQDALTAAINREVKTRREAKQNTKELNKLKDDLNATDEEGIKKLNEVNEKVDQNNKLLAESGSELEKRRANVGNYSASIQDAFANIDIMNGGLGGFIARSNQAGGAGKLLKGTFTEIKTSVIDLSKSLIATPVGAFITALAGIALAGKALYSYNNELEKTLKITKQFTGLAGDELEAVGVKINGIVDRTGANQKEVLQAVQALVNDFGLSYDEAFEKINLGYQRAGSSAEDFFDNTAEYSTFLAQAGYNADEFFAIMQAGAQNGVYKDKILDSLKEVDIRLKEMPKSASDALINAFGTNFESAISKGVKTGETTTKEALLLINKEADKTGLNFQQKGQLIADVFGAAGEDAGGFVKVLDSVTEGISKAGAGMTELETAQKAANDAQDEMNQAFADLFHVSDGGFELMKSQLMEGVYTAITAVVDGVIDCYNWFVDLYNESESFAGVMNTIGAVGKFVFNNLSMGIQNIATGFKGLGAIVSAIFKGEFSSISGIWSDTMGEIVQTSKDTITESANNFVEAWDGKNKKLERINKNTVKSVDNVGKEMTKTITKAGNDVTKLTDAQKKAQEKLLDAQIAKQKEQLNLWIAQQGDKARTFQEELSIQEEISKKSIAILDNELKNKKISQEKYDLEVLKLKQQTAKKQASAAVEAATIELDRIEYENKSKLEKGQLLTDDLLMQEIERNQLIREERDKFAKSQFDQGLINNTEFQKALLENEREFLEEEKTLKEKNQADNRTIETTKRAQEFQENMLLLQENLASEFEIRKAQAQFEFDENKLQLEQQRADGLITEENYQLSLDSIINTHSQFRKRIEEEVQNAKLSISKEVFSGVAELIGEQTAAGKAAGIATATINTFQGASEVLKSPAVFPEPYNTILKVLQMGVTIGTGLNTVKKITAVKTPSVKGYATGGKVTGGIPIQRSNGDNVLATLKIGEAVLNEKQQSFIGRDLLSLAGVPGFATGGVVGSSSTSAAIQNNLFRSQPLFDVDTFVNRVETAVQNGSQNGSQLGSQVGSQQGISQLSSNRGVQGSGNY